VDQLTDVLVTNMLTNQKVRIKCKELVRKVSIYKDKMAVMLGERILVYVCVQLEVIYKLILNIRKMQI
jgi:intraflagellar transport protein 122